MKDYAKTIVSQYSSSETLCQLISTINDWIDPNTNFEQFYDYIWNVQSAQGYGLDVWGRIVGVTRNLAVQSAVYFGFAEATNLSSAPFDSAPFYDGKSQLVEQYSLDDNYFRILIYAKALQNITDCSIPAINSILMTLFPNRGNAYVVDTTSLDYPHFGFAEAIDADTFGAASFGDMFEAVNQNMSITYVFNFILTPDEQAIVNQSGAIPKPTGVKATSTLLLNG